MKNIYDHDIYRKVNYIRKTVNGYTEARFGSEFYVVENLPKDIRVLDIDQLTYLDIKLEKEKEYFISSQLNIPKVPFLSIIKAKYDDITTSSSNNLQFKFTYNDDSRHESREIKINFSNASEEDRRIFEVEKTRKLSTVFRFGRKLLVLESIHGLVEPSTHPSMGVFIPPDHHIRKAEIQEFSSELVKDDQFKVESWDLDIDFKIGDKVVVSDWYNPMNMLVVKQIEDFKENKETGDIYFILKDKEGNLSEVRYVIGHKSSVKAGLVRKITNRWEGLDAGTKIVAKEAGISMFPKKDTNIIIGFLYDTGGPEPLVLCSNGCTLWYSDVMSKFELITINNKKWKNLKCAPIASLVKEKGRPKIRFQAGDLLTRSNYSFGFLLHKSVAGNLRAYNLSTYEDYRRTYILNRSFMYDIQMDCFPNPRLTARQESELGFFPGFPNYHGMFTLTTNKHTNSFFINEPRSILNVPSNSE